MLHPRYSLFFLFFFFSSLLNAQSLLPNEVYIPLSQEQKFDSLLMLQKELNTLDSTIPGYRLQIFFESGNYSKAKALEVKTTFEEEYPGMKAYVSFNEPYYRVRVGDFKTKIEAVGFLKKILKVYPNAFEVKDRISFESIE